MAKKFINQKPSRGLRGLLALLPFVFLLVLYLIASELRLAENPNDKILPSLATLGQSIVDLAFREEARSGKWLLWNDTFASLRLLLQGLLIAAVLSLLLGILLGLIPVVQATFSPFMRAVAMIPPLALLPIFFISFGLGDSAKIALIVFGITPFLIRELALRLSELPQEQLIKAQTLGASTWLIIMRIVLPQTMPRLLDGLRLALGTAWLFLIAAEAISATEGLGYRIFLVRRYLAMEVILPYVIWITFLAFILDWALKRLIFWLYPWYQRP